MEYHKLLLEKNLMLNGMMLVGYNKLKKYCNKQLYYLLNFHKFLLGRGHLGEVFCYMDHLEQVRHF